MELEWESEDELGVVDEASDYEESAYEEALRYISE